MRQVRRNLALMDDPEINDYIQALGKKLAAKSGAAGTDSKFFVIEDPAINAFAFLGGYVGVHTGLILAAQSESEVAAVMAHEIAHISQRHVMRMIAQNKRTSKQMLAALLAAVLLAGAGEGQGAQAAIALGQAGVAQKGINFTRSNEEEADRVGIQILAEAGFDPRAMPAFFESLQSASRINETALPEFLRTHPVTSRRIAESRTRAETYDYRQVPDSPEFYRIRAKVRATTRGNARDIAKRFRLNLAEGKYRNLEAERYGYAIALMRVKDYDAARKQIAILLRDRPDIASYRILEAEIELAAGQYTKALELYAATSKKFSGNRALSRYYAAALLKAGRPEQARTLLKKAVKRQSDDPGLQKMLATAAGESGKLFEAHQALANYYYLNGDPGAAIQQLQIARRFTGDSFYLQSSVDARIKEIQQELGAVDH
jgi:predicted Zn-dependent protease